MGSRFAALKTKEIAELKAKTPETIGDIEETSNCYFLVYDGTYSIAEGSILAIKYKLPLSYIEKPIKRFERNPQHPRIVTIRL